MPSDPIKDTGAAFCPELLHPEALVGFELVADSGERRVDDEVAVDQRLATGVLGRLYRFLDLRTKGGNLRRGEVNLFLHAGQQTRPPVLRGSSTHRVTRARHAVGKNRPAESADDKKSSQRDAQSPVNSHTELAELATSPT